MMNNSSSECLSVEEEYLNEKLWLVVICGSSIAICGVLFNLILLITLSWPKKYRHSQNIYLGLLAIFDVGVCICYIPIFSVEILYYYLDSFPLFYAWHMYTPLVFTLSRIAQTGTTYTLIAATADRLYSVRASALRETLEEEQEHDSPFNRFRTKRIRLLILFQVIAFTVITRLPMYWELEVKTFPQCTHFAFMYMGLTELARSKTYNTYFRFWFQHIIQIFAPFVALVTLNVFILYRLRQMEASAPPLHRLLANSTIPMVPNPSRNSRTRKQATRTVAALVTIYLCCNSLGLLIGLLEHIKPTFLFAHQTFFTFAVDVNTLLHLINSVIRIFIYYKCDSNIRKGLKHFLATIIAFVHRPELMLVQHKGISDENQNKNAADGVVAKRWDHFQNNHYEKSAKCLFMNEMNSTTPSPGRASTTSFEYIDL